MKDNEIKGVLRELFSTYMGRYNVTTQELADRSGIAHPTIYRMVNGKTIPRLDALMAVVHAFPEEGGRTLLHELFNNIVQ